MTYDQGLAEIMRDNLADETGITEKKMFGGLCFMMNGNMVCGVHAGGGMFRVGKSREAEARTIEGAGALTFTGRPMGGMIEVDEDALADDERRLKWIALAVKNAASLPAK